MLHQIGERVGALQRTEENTVYVFGFGVYEGHHPVDPEAGGFNFGQSNPRIRLDSGKVVWGCECWWGPEELIRKHMEGRVVVEVDIDDARRIAKENAP